MFSGAFELKLLPLMATVDPTFPITGEIELMRGWDADNLANESKKTRERHLLNSLATAVFNKNMTTGV